MIAACTLIDDRSFVLFHVEQQKKWKYRWRLVGELPSIYLKWREGVSDDSVKLLQSEVSGCQVEVEYWVEGSGWVAAQSVKLLAGKLSVVIEALEDVSFSERDHTFIAEVPLGVACFKFSGLLEMSAGESCAVDVVADCCAPANIIHKEGSFHARGLGLEITNAGVISDYFEGVAGPMVLTADPVLMSRRLFAFPKLK